MLVVNYKENLTKGKPYIDYKGAVTFSLGTIAFLYALLTGSQTQDWANPVIIGLFIFAFITFIAFVRIELKSPEPLIPLNLFKNRSVLIVNSLTLIVGAIVICITIYLPIWSQGVMGKTATQAGLVLMPLPVCWTLGSLVAGHLVGRLRDNWIITLGLAIVSGASVIFFALTAHSPTFLIYVASGTLGLGMGLMMPIFMLIIQSSVPTSKRGVAVASNTFTNTFSQTLGSAVFGTIFNIITLSKAKKAGQDDLDLNASFEHGNLPTEKLVQLQEILASGVHVIYGVMLLLVIIGFGISFLLIKERERSVEESSV
jgi:MFS family permease